MPDDHLQQPLILPGDHEDEEKACRQTVPLTKRSSSRCAAGIAVALLAGGFLLAFFFLESCPLVAFKHKTRHGHVNYQATLKKNQQIEYAREFTAPCDYGILVFNVGPARNYLPYFYDIYQDAYVFSNNKKMCWAYPEYRGIQKGPFPWWVSGDPTSFDVPLGKTPVKISNRIVRPADAKNFTATKGGDFLIIGRGKFYTPFFYQSLKSQINSWGANDGDEHEFGDFGNVLENLTLAYVDDWEGAGEFEIMA